MPNLMTTVLEIKNAHEDYMRVPKLRSLAPNIRAAQGWTPPNPGTNKVNCDTSWCKETKLGGIVVVARNSDGQFIGGPN